MTPDTTIADILAHDFGPGADETETAEMLSDALAAWTRQKQLRPDRAADHFASLADACQVMGAALREDARRMEADG